MECSACSLTSDGSTVTISFCGPHTPEKEVSLTASYYWNPILAISQHPIRGRFSMERNRESLSYVCDLTDWIKENRLKDCEIYVSCQIGAIHLTWAKPIVCRPKKTPSQQAISAKISTFCGNGEGKLFYEISAILQEAKSLQDALDNLHVIEESERAYYARLTSESKSSATDEIICGGAALGCVALGLFGQTFSAAIGGAIGGAVATAVVIGKDEDETRKRDIRVHCQSHISLLKEKAEKIIDRMSESLPEVSSSSILRHRRHS